MPQNLNALIRYKTIDKCLRNRYKPCTIELMIENCSEALGEARGRYQKISERTIRYDISRMKSEILDFNAPIAVKDGVYFYTDPEYSIFNVPIKEKKVLETVLEILIENRKEIGYNIANKAIIDMAEIIGTLLPAEIYDELDSHTIKFSLGGGGKADASYSIPAAELEAIKRKLFIQETIQNNKKLLKENQLYMEETRSEYRPNTEKTDLPWLYHWQLVLDIVK